MRLAVMQPYFLPYLGYWQLLAAVDRFVVYDDVNYMPRGWVNRNRLLIQGQVHYLTLPVRDASQNRRIDEILLVEDRRARRKLLRTIETSYRRAPHFATVFPVLESVFAFDSDKLADFLLNQIRSICRLLAIQTPLVASSRIYGNAALRSSERIIDICVRNQAAVYINPAGGRALYRAEDFQARGIRLQFLSAGTPDYPQGGAAPFVPQLSIVDPLMQIGVEGVRRHLAAYRLEDAVVDDAGTADGATRLQAA